MDALSSADGSTGSADPVEELAGRVRATGAGARSLCAWGPGGPTPRRDGEPQGGHRQGCER
jgi:hypothetical protein